MQLHIKVGKITTYLNIKIDFNLPGLDRGKSWRGNFMWMTPIIADMGKSAQSTTELGSQVIFYADCLFGLNNYLDMFPRLNISDKICAMKLNEN